MRQKVSEVADVTKEIVHIEGDRFFYLSGTKATKCDRPVNVVHYKRTPDRLKQMDNHEVVKEKDEAILKKDWKVDVPLRAKFKDHQPAFLEILKEYESMWDKHRGRIIVAKHRINLRNDHVSRSFRPIQARPSAGKLAAAENGRMICEKVIGPATTK